MSERRFGLGHYLELSETCLQERGFSDITLNVAIAARLGARQLLQVHGASPQELQLVYKANDGDTPQTVADIKSGQKITRMLERGFANASINEEESGLKKRGTLIFHIDPVDGTSSFAREQRHSTVGAAAYDDELPLSSAICNPFERELLVAEKGKGAYLINLNDRLALTGSQRELQVSPTTSLSKAMIYIDASFYQANGERKLELMKRLHEASGKYILFRQTGSNIDQQRQVAAGRGDLTITDTIGGFYDVAAGRQILEESGGIMLDENGKPVSEKSYLAIGGNENLVHLVLPFVQTCYQGYTGFK